MAGAASPSRLTGFLFVLCGAIFFSAKAIFIKFAYAEGISALPLLTLRMVFAAPVFLLSVLYLHHRNHGMTYRRKDFLMTLLLGALGYYGSSLLDFLGLHYISAGLERLTLFLYPTFVILFSALFLKIPIKAQNIRSLVFCYIGIALAFAGEMRFSSTPHETVLGTLLVLAAAVTYAFYLMGNGVYVQRLGSIRFTAFAMMSACAAVTIHFLLAYPVSTLFQYSWKIYGYALLLAIFCTVLPAFMVSAGIKIIGASAAGIISTIGPVSTILLGVIFLHEPLTAVEVIGMICVVIGVVNIREDKK